MWEWLAAPIAGDGIHAMTDLRSWHARLMFLAWGVVAPLAVLIARYFKVLPGQDWPRQLDSQFWWRCHWIGQSIVFALSVSAGLLMIVESAESVNWHGRMGYAVLGLVSMQVVFGYFRGSKGGPGERQLVGDHYLMSPRRRVFEWVHKFCGYLVLALAAFTIVFGLWNVNAPRWMWLLIVLWWCVLGVAVIALQRRGMAIETYQAIWGPDPKHPGNTHLSAAWGTHRRDTSGATPDSK